MLYAIHRSYKCTRNIQHSLYKKINKNSTRCSGTLKAEMLFPCSKINLTTAKLQNKWLRL